VGCARVVITHGTATITLTAQALFSVRDKTVVLTGAPSAARFGESDPAFNMGMVFATARTAPPGVYITINGSVLRDDQVVKDRERGVVAVNAMDLTPWVR
jgi:L-asparaginase